MRLDEFKKSVLLELNSSGVAESEAAVEFDLLLNFVFGIDKKEFYLNPEKILEQNKINLFNSLLSRRIKEKKPVQYLTNRAYFMGEEFFVDERVLIPRQETEILVGEVVKLLQENFNEPVNILDIGTGSGCIACMLAKNSLCKSITAIDISDSAIEVAKINAEKLKVADKIEFKNVNIFEEIFFEDKFSLVVSNPPYIPKKIKNEIQEEVLLHEPNNALFAEDDEGLEFYARIINLSPKLLVKNGYMAFESGFNQAQSIKNIFESCKYTDIRVIKDYNQIERVVTGKY